MATARSATRGSLECRKVALLGCGAEPAKRFLHTGVLARSFDELVVKGGVLSLRFDSGLACTRK